eukprot:s1353_g23.t1
MINLEASVGYFGRLPAIPALSMPRDLALSTPWGSLRSDGGATPKLLLRGFQLQQVAFIFALLLPQFFQPSLPLFQCALCVACADPPCLLELSLARRRGYGHDMAILSL